MRSRRWACSMNVTACAGAGTIPKPHTAASATAQRAREREGKRNAMRPQGRKRTKRPDAGAVTMGNKHRAAIIPCRAFVAARNRSEEHTSELQSRRDLVCRLLPENKTDLTDLYNSLTGYSRKDSYRSL